jgi:hypothetical protein
VLPLLLSLPPLLWLAWREEEETRQALRDVMEVLQGLADLSPDDPHKGYKRFLCTRLAFLRKHVLPTFYRITTKRGRGERDHSPLES